jgi:hypothetical protein
MQKSGDIDPLILEVGSTWKFGLHTLYSQEKGPPVPISWQECVEPRDGLRVLETGCISYNYQESKHDSLIVEPRALSLYQLSYPSSFTRQDNQIYIREITML